MGAWGSGLYDNDGALDQLGALVEIEGEERDAARLVARIGLLAWLNPASLTHNSSGLRDRIGALAEDIERLPADTRAALQSLLDDAEAATKHGARTPEVRAAIGGYSDGPRLDPLLRIPEATAVVNELAERAAHVLDRALAENNSLHELMGDLAALAVLIELKEAGLWTPSPARVAAWRFGFDGADKRTTEERSFWWKYVRRARLGFDVLIPPAPEAAKPGAHRRSAPALVQTETFQRYEHPKFGAATLLARSGSGPSERLELRFDDGVVRTILARFVAAIGP